MQEKGEIKGNFSPFHFHVSNAVVAGAFDVHAFHSNEVNPIINDDK